MLLIAAALLEEVDIALSLCTHPTKVACEGVRIWSAVHRDRIIHFLKTGVGPKKSSGALEKTFRYLRPTSILVIGYAGSLSGKLKLGELAVIQRAFLLGGGEKSSAPIEETKLTEAWDLTDCSVLLEGARAAGTSAHLCDSITSPHIIGKPSQKRFLGERFGVSVIDMETAALARVAASMGISLACVRSVSDEVDDTFLAPFSYDPSSTPLRRAARVVSAGDWIRRYGEWRKRATIARESLRRFLTAYLADLQLTIDD
jgi:nucleoside phosphorylase